MFGEGGIVKTGRKTQSGTKASQSGLTSVQSFHEGDSSAMILRLGVDFGDSDGRGSCGSGEVLPH